LPSPFGGVDWEGGGPNSETRKKRLETHSAAWKGTKGFSHQGKKKRGTARKGEERCLTPWGGKIKFVGKVPVARERPPILGGGTEFMKETIPIV